MESSDDIKQAGIDAASDITSVSVETLRNWIKKGLLRTAEAPSGQKLLDIKDVRHVANQHNPDYLKTTTPNFRVLTSDATEETTIDLFAGAGGTALGIENAGFKNIMANEIDHDACETLRRNRPLWNIVEEDIHNIDFSQYAGTVSLLQGGVPCQAFSYAGKKRGFADTRGTLFFEFARAIRECQPKAIMMENVKGLLTHDNGKTLDTMLSALVELGYRVAFKVLRAQFMDVAQKRERLVILGTRSDLNMPILFPKEDQEIMTLWDAIGDCPDSQGISYSEKKRKILAMVPEGGNWKDLPPDVQREYLGASYGQGGGKTGMARRLAWNEPALTLTCSPAQKQTERCHPDQTRPLTVREYARIQSFPDDWEFCGNTTSQYRQIGNAVPPNMAYHIGRGILAMLGNGNADDFAEANEICPFA